MTTALVALWLTALIGLPPAHILEPERALTVLEKRRQKLAPLRVEAELTGVDSTWPHEIVFEMHPLHGFRISDDQGGRWVIHGSRLRAGSTEPAPSWIPQLELLALRSLGSLTTALRRLGVDLERNELARCGEGDCFVLGGLNGRGQLWLDKDSFEVVRFTFGSDLIVEYLNYSDWEGHRFPAIIELRDGRGTFATLVVHSVRTTDTLSAADFSPAWVGSTSP